MVELYAQDIPAGSHTVYAYITGKYGDEIDTTCTFQPYRDGVLIAGAHGVITRQVLKAWFDHARQHGFYTVYFSRAGGVSFTRFAKFSHSECGLDYYRIGL